MRTPDFGKDGWCLDDGEERHLAAPTTFVIPPRWGRDALEPGDFAKLIFRIAIEDDDEPDEFERMGVIVRERIPGGYLGMLNNTPGSVDENDQFWVGAELPFERRHVIDVREANAESLALASKAVPIPWKRS